MSAKIFVTGANGQLGRLVIDALLTKVPAKQLVAGVRTPEKAADLVALGVEVRETDYNRPETLEQAFAGIDKLLLISSSEVGKRLPQHQAVIAAAQQAEVKQLVYTSLLHADRSVLKLLADEHWPTEQAIQASGLPFVILRNGWYTENYVASVPAAINNGAFYGSAGEGRIASAARQDYAEAAAVVLTSGEKYQGQTLELAGDESYNLGELAAVVSQLTGKAIPYHNLSVEDYSGALVAAGLPEPIAQLLTVSDSAAEQGALFDESHVLQQLIGRKTTPLKEIIAAAIA